MKKRILSGILVLLGLGGIAWSQEQISLTKTAFNEKEYNETILTVEQYGYYSIRTESKFGTSLQLVNQMSGPTDHYGSAGHSDGRLDLLLDEGQYKIRMYSAKDRDALLKLSVHTFKELNTPKALVLRSGQRVEMQLKDLEQASWWIEVEKDNQPVYLEAQGRNLAKLAVWKDGSWLEDVQTFSKTVEHEPGQPMTSVLINTRLPKGYYKITAYGGPAQKWAQGSQSHPFFLKYGLDVIPSNSRFAGTISKYGYNRYLVQGRADFFLLQVREKKDYALKVQSLSANEDFNRYDYTAKITKKSRTPQAFINRSYYNKDILITIEGKPGDPFVLQTLYSSESMYVRPPETGKYWVSTVHSGFIGDNIDASGFLLDTYKEDRVIAKNMPVLSKRQGWTRHFNLMTRVTLFYDVQQSGDYEISFSGTEAETKIEPYLTSYPKNYQSPPYKKGKHIVRLEKGIQILQIRPVKKGIIAFQIKPKGLTLGKKSESPFQGNVQVPQVELNRNHSYQFLVAHQGEIKSGVQLRELPLDLSQALSVYLQPGQSVELPVKLTVDSVILVGSESGSAYSLQQGSSGLKSGESVIKAGQHTLTLINKGKQTEMFSIQTVDIQSLPGAEPEYLSTKVVDSFPDFEIIQADKVRHLDLDDGERKIFMLKVDKPGIYKVQSTGLLKTKATMRDRLNPFLDSAQANGPGRNFLLQSYLKQGVYQIKVETLNQSAGHLGILLEYIPPLPGGQLVEGKTMKATVPAGDSLIYTFKIPQKHAYELSTIGMGRDYPSRLEDSQGYPLYRPNSKTSFSLKFRPGDYRLISLPQEVEGKRLTALTRIVQADSLQGKGPIPLKLNSVHYNTWNEGNGMQRQGDVYTFSLPATMPVQIHFSETMWARLYSTVGGQKRLVKKIYPQDKDDHELPPGSYILELFTLRKGNLVDYNVSLSTRVLVDGLSYETSPGRAFDVIVEVPSLVEFRSEGKPDVAAELYNEQGKLIEVVDDSLNDWNFIFSRYLPAGKYRLWIASKAGYGKTRVYMNILKKVTRPSLSAVQNKTIDMQGKKNIYPLTFKEGFYHVNVDANSRLALSLLQEHAGIWSDYEVTEGQDIDSYIFLNGKGNKGLALWSLDHIDEELTLSLREFQPRSVTLSSLAKGLIITGSGQGIALAVKVDQASSFRVECVDAESGKAVKRLYYTTMKDHNRDLVWQPMRNDFISSSDGILYINIPRTGKLKLTLTENRIISKNAQGVSLKGGEKAFFQLDQKKAGIHLALVQGSMGQPLVSFPDSGSSIRLPDGTGVSTAFAFHHAGALAVSLKSDPGPVLVWNPLRELGEAGINLTYYLIPRGKSTSLKQSDESDLAPGESKTYAAGNPVHFTTALRPGMVAFTHEGDKVIEVHYSHESSTLFSFREKAKQITLLNTGDDAQTYYLEQSRSVPVLQKGSLLVENTFSRAGYIEQEITAHKYFTHLYSSPNVRISLLDAQGYMQQTAGGEPLQIQGGYHRYVLEHKAEYSKVWMGSALLQDRWGVKKPSGVKRLDSPGFIDLGQVQWFRINTGQASVLHIDSQHDFVSALVVDGKFSLVDEVKGPGSSVALLVPGITLLGLRGPVQADGSGGQAYLHWRPVEDMMAAQGKRFLLTDKQSRAFSFSIDTQREVALGYNAPSDLIRCRLYDGSGSLVADGPVIFTTLDAGKYTVIYTLKEDMDMSDFSPIYVDNKTIEDKILSDKVREFLTKYGYLKGN